MIALGIIAGLVGLLTWAWIYDARRDKKRLADLECEKTFFFASECAKPRSCLEVKLADGRVLLSPGFEPTAEIHYGWLEGLHTSSSLERAQRAAERIITLGRYYHAAREEYVPLLGIRSTRIVNVKEEK